MQETCVETLGPTVTSQNIWISSTGVFSRSIRWTGEIPGGVGVVGGCCMVEAGTVITGRRTSSVFVNCVN